MDPQGVEVGAHRREWGAQFVCGVGGEILCGLQELVVACWAAASRLSIAVIASDSSSASRTPRTSGIRSVSLPSRLVCSVSLRSGRIAGPASSQPRPAAINTVATPTAVYSGILARFNRMLSARMPTDISTPPCWSTVIGPHPVLDRRSLRRSRCQRQRRQLQSALEHHLAGGLRDRPVVSTPRRGILQLVGIHAGVDDRVESAIQLRGIVIREHDRSEDREHARRPRTQRQPRRSPPGCAARRTGRNRGKRTYGSSRSTYPIPRTVWITLGRPSRSSLRRR